MGIGENTFIFNLTKEIEYSKKGTPDNKTLSLEFRNPGMAEYDYITNLSQLVMNAIIEVSLNNKDQIAEHQENTTGPKDKPKLGGAEVKGILFSAKSVKFTQIAKEFKPLAFITCTMDGSEKLTELLLNRMTIEDFNRLVCEYIAFFIAPSLLSEEGA